jgi:hypothetical protein
LVLDESPLKPEPEAFDEPAPEPEAEVLDEPVPELLEVPAAVVGAGCVKIDANTMILTLRFTGPTTWFCMIASQIASGSGTTCVWLKSNRTEQV